MNPYVIIPTCIIGPAEIPDTEEQKDKVFKGRWQPDQIQGYVPGYYFGSMVYMLGGTSFMTPLTVDQLDALIDRYWIALEKKEKDKTNPLIQTV